jgi:hypothetical protein
MCVVGVIIHFIDLKYGNRKSSFAKHLLDNEHSVGPIEDIVNILNVTK